MLRYAKKGRKEIAIALSWAIGKKGAKEEEEEEEEEELDLTDCKADITINSIYWSIDS